MTASAMSFTTYMTMTLYTLTIFVLCVLMLPTGVLGGVYCTGMMTAPESIEGDIYVHGTACLIRGVRVGGIITVRDGAVLRTDGNTYIEGSIVAEGAGNILLLGTTKLIGDVHVSNPLPGSVFIVGPHAHINKIGIAGPADVLIRGKTGALSVEWGANIVVGGGEVGAGGLMVEGGKGTLVLCEANIGGAKIAELKGQILAWARPGCPPSNITGSLSIEKGAGLVKIVRNSLDAGDLSVGEQDGHVEIVDTVVGDMGLNDISGTILMRQVIADSDGIVSGALKGITIEDSEINGDFLVGHNTGDVVIRDCKIGGDVAIEQTYGNVLMTNNVANYAAVSISRTLGEIHFKKNRQLSISMVENMDLYMANNFDIRTAAIQKNSGTCSITDNYVGSMRCLGNHEIHPFTGNTITGLANGQCHSL